MVPEKRLIRETSVRESSYPGNVYPGNVLSGKRLSGKVTVRETSDNRQEYGLVPFSNNIRGDTPVRYPVKST